MSEAHVQLREHDKIENGERRITYVWNLTDTDDGGTRQAVLNVEHRKHRRGGAFTAAALSRTEHKSPTAISFEFEALTQGICRIAREPVNRYSEAKLEAFAAKAVEILRARYGSQDPEVGSYFAGRRP